MRFLLSMFLVVGASLAQAQTFTTKPFLSVQGHAEAKVKPDVFPVQVTVTDTGTNPAKIQTLVEGLAQKVVVAAKARGAADSDMQVGNLSVSPETKWNDDSDTETFLGNTYERAITVRFHDLEQLRNFIADLPDQKQVRIQTQTFQYSDQRALQRKLRKEAIEDAEAAAKDMAASVDKRLVELFNVSDRAQSTLYSNIGYSSNSDGYSARSLDAVSVSGTRRTSDIVLKEGEITVSADAFLVYIIGD